MSKRSISFISKADDYLSIQKQLRVDGLTLRGNPKVLAEKIKMVKKQKAEPQAVCGFNLHVMRREVFEDPGIPEFIDTRRVVSLICLNEIKEFSLDTSGIKSNDFVSTEESNFLELYITKLPILCINYLRLQYTLDAFKFRKRVNLNNETDALGFYLKQDIGECKYDIQKRLPPNEEFSNFVHRLRLCGYKNYIFNLARHLAYDVEYMRTSVRDLVYVYKFVGQRTFGVLTVFHDDEHKWYVKVSESSLMRYNNKLIDIEFPTKFY